MIYSFKNKIKPINFYKSNLTSKVEGAKFHRNFQLEFQVIRITFRRIIIAYLKLLKDRQYLKKKP